MKFNLIARIILALVCIMASAVCSHGQNSTADPVLCNSVCIDANGKICGTSISATSFPCNTSRYPTSTQTLNVPSLQAGLITWLDASYTQDARFCPANTCLSWCTTTLAASNPAVTRFYDVSGNNHSMQITRGNWETQRDTYSVGTASGYPYVKCDDSYGGHGFEPLQVSQLDLSAGANLDITVFTVYSRPSSSGGGGVWGQDEGDGRTNTDIGKDRAFYSFLQYNNNNYTSGGNDAVIATGQGMLRIPNGGSNNIEISIIVYDGNIVGGVNVGVPNGSAVYRDGNLVTTFTDNTRLSSTSHKLRLGCSYGGAYSDTNQPTTDYANYPSGFRMSNAPAGSLTTAGNGGVTTGFNGGIAEFIVYNRKLEPCEINAVNSYLSNKYRGIYNPPNITPAGPVRACGSVVLSSSPAGSYTWQKWVGGAWQIITGATDRTYTVMTSGRYTVNNTCGQANANAVDVKIEAPLSPAFSITVPTTAGPYPPNYPLRFSATTVPATNRTYTWDWGDGTPSTVTASKEQNHSFAQGKVGAYSVRLTVRQTYPAIPASVGSPAYDTISCRYAQIMPVSIYRPLCQSVAPVGQPAPGTFVFDDKTGTIEFDASENCIPSIGLECLSGQATSLSRVVAVSMTALSDTLVQDEPDYRPGSVDSNPFLQGRGQLRPYATYTYQAALDLPTATIYTPVAPSTLANYNYEAGTFTATAFNHLTSARARPVAWLAASVAERISPNGEVLQERDALGIRSVAKYGYGVSTNSSTSTSFSTHTLPYLQAHNTEASSVLFESFENIYSSAAGWRGEDQLLLRNAEVVLPASGATTLAHTGGGAVQLINQGTDGYTLTLKSLPLTSQLTDEGILVKCWLYLPNFDFPNDNSAPVIGTLKALSGDGTTELRSANLAVVAQTGNWCLAEARLALPLTASGKPTLTNGMALLPRIVIDGSTTTTQLWVDDVRLQPGGAQMTAYVYDPSSFRLLASFDDQNYALLYQYNSEGQLIRKQAETMRGVKTLQETFYHTPQQARP